MRLLFARVDIDIDAKYAANNANSIVENDESSVE
jgi:hypothetical protein